MDDLFNLNASLDDASRMIQASVTRFVKEKILPTISQSFEQATFPAHWIQEIAALGLLGLTLPETYGGSNASYLAYGLVCQELEKGDSGLRSFVSVQNSLCMYPIFRYGSESQKTHFLPRMARGDIIGCFGLTEPDGGSDPAAMRTVAKKVPNGWCLNGSKMWITNAPIANLAIIWAKTHQGIRGFLVEAKSKGFQSETIKMKMSLRASSTGSLFLENVFVPDDHLLPGTSKGLSTALACLNQARYGIAFGAIGAAIACFDTTRDYLLSRQQFGKPLAAFQLIQQELADMYSEIIKANCLNQQLAILKDKDEATPIMISLAKRNACREALNIARKCRNLLGANGISLEYPIIRHLLNLESVFTYEGTDNIHTLILGKHITGIDAFS